MRKLVNRPIFWSWILVGIWIAHVVATIMLQRWDGMTISLLGALATLLIASTIHRRRVKNLYPK